MPTTPSTTKKNNEKRDTEAERERQRLKEGLMIDKQENSRWKQEYDEMKKSNPHPIK